MRKMKDSGVEWVEQIPDNWSVIANKYIMKKKKDICSKYNGEDILSLSMNGVIVRDLDAGGKMPTTFDGYQRIEQGNLLMCLFDIDVTPRCIGLINNNGLCSPAYSQFALSSSAYAPYYYYYYLSLDHTKELLHMAKNLRHSLTEEQLGQISVPVPPYDEQKLIAAFLDKKVAQVDQLIANEQAQIEKLKQYKQSLITEVVTKGLDPNVPMKDSGVEWIEEIPKEWNVSRLKALFDNGKGLPITKENLVEMGIPVISYGQIHSKTNSGTTVDKSLLRYVSEDYLTTNPSSLVKKGDFIFADTSEDREGCGNCVYIDDEITLFAGYHTIILKAKYDNSKYLAYLFLTDAWRRQIREKVSGVKLFSISRRILLDTDIILPPDNSQREIIEYLDMKSAEINQLITIKLAKIEKLAQYKKSLIYEYVTGKKEACCYDN